MATTVHLRALCVATRNTVKAIIAQCMQSHTDFNVDAIKTTEDAVTFFVECISNSGAANQIILAMIGIGESVPTSAPLAQEIDRLEVDGVCGDQCKAVAVLIDRMIEQEIS